MPVSPTYPGVYVEEIPSGVRTITGVATSITAFLGRAKRGPVNQAYTINSFGDYERTFGGLDLNSTMSYAVRDFYLNGGSQAIIVRLFSPLNSANDARKSHAAAQAIADTAKRIVGTDDTIPITQAQVDKLTTDTGELMTEVKKSTADPDKSAALAVADAVKSTAKLGVKPSVVQSAADAAAATFPITKASLVVNGINTDSAAVKGDKGVAAAQTIADKVKDIVGTDDTIPLTQPKVDDLTGDAGKLMTQVKTFTADSEKSAANAVAAAVKPAATVGAIPRDVQKAAVAAVASVTLAVAGDKSLTDSNALQLEAFSEGAWGNQLIARIEYVTDKAAENIRDRFNMPPGTLLFDLLVHDRDTRSSEVYRNLTYADTSRQVTRVLEAESTLVRVNKDTPPPLTGRPVEHEKPDPGKAWFDDKNKLRTYSEVADGDKADSLNPLGQTLGIGDYTGSEDPSKPKTGMHALDNVDLFNLLCIPPDTRPDGDTHPDVYVAAMNYCQQKRAMLIVDSPFAWSANIDTAANTAKNAFVTDPILSGLPARNAAVFFPRVMQADPLRENQIDEFVPCGIVAGIMASTDTARGVWKAPAGLDAAVQGVRALKVNLNDAENGILNPLGINCLRSFPIYGKVVWGARTLRGADQLADEYKYIPVRRTALFIEESLYRGLQWVVFEPNDEPLWAQIRLNAGAFMHNLFRQGAFQGSTPRDAYFVKCDKETTTQNDINLGIVNIVVGFAPLKPAEFVFIKLQQMAGQIDV
jgi:uncharacterized protein